MLVGWDAAVQAQPWNWGAFQLLIDGNWSAADEMANGAVMPNSGGAVMRLGPAFVVSPRVDLMIRVAASLPVVQAYNGQQRDGAQATVALVWDIR
jgi:hypothetical protein